MPGDSSKNCSESYICTSTQTTNLFGVVTQSKTFDYYFYSPHNYVTKKKIYVKGFGFYYLHVVWWGFMNGGQYDYTLRGCIINGILYGDTLTVGVKNIGMEIPKAFSLFQNYPNPFNPSTTIRFDIPNSSFVKLTTYNLTGKELELLVNEKLDEGSYEVKWDGSNYSSGVYFYKINADDFEQVRKMILLK